jgi:secreted trypsin-like serine protease
MLGSISASSPSAGHVMVNVTEAIKHAAYNDTAITNDIAILKLASNVTLTGKSLKRSHHFGTHCLTKN